MVAVTSPICLVLLATQDHTGVLNYATWSVERLAVRCTTIEMGMKYDIIVLAGWLTGGSA
jgi:hypothetical protein